MIVRDGIAGLASLPPGLVMSVGNFDGLHLGHLKIFELCRRLKSAGATGIAVITFEPHPLTVLRPEHAPPRLATLSMKRELLADAGIDFLVELAPTPDVLNVSAEQFWAILRDQTRPLHLIEGATFTFGRAREGTISRLREWCKGSPITLHEIEGVLSPLLDLQIAPVSSSLIRWLLAHGRARDASICLGRPYTLRSPVVKGFQRGRTIGVPTANLMVTEQLIPAEGVYAARCTFDGVTYPAALSIGTMPTFGDHPPQVEAHLVGFTGNLYDRTIDLEVMDWLRDQRKFPGLDLLKHQLQKDIAAAEQLAPLNRFTPIAQLSL